MIMLLSYVNCIFCHFRLFLPVLDFNECLFFLPFRYTAGIMNLSNRLKNVNKLCCKYYSDELDIVR